MGDLSDMGVTPTKLGTPRPLIEADCADPYPVEMLPPLIRDAVEEVASYVQAPVALIAGSALAAVSSAVQTGFSVQRSSALSGPATLYLLTVAESGERKTTVDNIFIGPIREWEAAQRKLLGARRAEYKAELEDWEQQAEELQRNIKSGFLTPQPGQLDPRVVHDLAKPKEPRPIRLLREDDTPEALAMALENYPVASIITAEAGTIFGSHGMNAESVTRNLAQANKMWEGGSILRGRAGSGELHVEGMRVTMGLQVQPQVLDGFVQRTGGLAKGIGYFARFLFCRPDSTQGRRYFKEAPDGRPAHAAFCNRMTTLLALEAVFDDYDRLRTQYIGFDPTAQLMWIGFHNEVEELQGADCEYSGIKDVASKAADNAARLACCLHVFQHGPSEPIGSDAMRAACNLMRWYLDEAVRFGRTAAAAPELADAQLLEEWLVREVLERIRTNGNLLISVNDVKKKGPNRLRQAHSRKLDDALELLADHNRVAVSKRIGKKGTDIAVHPDVLAEHRH